MPAHDPDPLQALHRFVACFGRFWAADRPAMRRLRPLALLDPDVGAVIAPGTSAGSRD